MKAIALMLSGFILAQAIPAFCLNAEPAKLPQEPSGDVSYSKNQDSTLVLFGVVGVGGRYRAAIKTGRLNSERWYDIADDVDGRRIEAIGKDSVTLKSNDTGETFVLKVRPVTIHQSSEDRLVRRPLLEASQVDWNWIRSDANPMRKKPESLPPWAQFGWNDLPEHIRIDFRNYYRSHGWDLTKVDSRPELGTSRYSIGPLENPSDPKLTREEKLKKSVRASP